MFAATKILTLVLLVAACSVGEVPLEGGGGEVDAGGSNNGDPNAASFEATIKPLVTSCLGCHSGLQNPNLNSYSALGAAYKVKPGASNILVTKGDHQGAIYFNTQQQQTVAGWIDGLQ